jgi:phospholipase D-like protein
MPLGADYNFRRHDHSGWAKAGWTLLLIAVPLVGALIYQIARPKEVPFGDEPTIAVNGDYATPTAGRDEVTRIRTGL